jgi:hypothetical protein
LSIKCPESVRLKYYLPFFVGTVIFIAQKKRIFVIKLNPRNNIVLFLLWTFLSRDVVDITEKKMKKKHTEKSPDLKS